MDKAELLATFTERVNQFEKYQSFIAKAREQAGKFASAVVDKVVRDNTQKCMDIVSEIVPLTGDIEQVIEELRQTREAALDSAKESQFRLEELELRLAIGDLSDPDFRAEAADYKAVVQSTDARVAEIDQERMRFAEALERWNRFGADPRLMSSFTNAHAEPAPSRAAHRSTPVPERPAERYASAPPASVRVHGGHLDRGDRSGGQMVSVAPNMHEDVLEAHDAEEEDDANLGAAGDDLVFDDNNHVAQNDGFEVDGIDLLGDEEDVPVDEGPVADKEDKPRRAVLLYQEGTAEEQIYPFTGEVMSLGRGRDNDVQVKNDSKVSRYHCKLYRRGPNFYIEDNKSANGTLVNGELITERRLFGGEEVIIGETFFRFRILD
jgi:hypothetical protein